MKKKIAIFLFGAPGSGKGTQAERLANEWGLVHFNTGAVIERVVHDPNRQSDPVIQRERQLFDSGILNNPEWVTQVVIQESKRFFDEGTGLIFSGSPRTLPEARAEVPVFEDLYGSANLFFVRIIVHPETSIFRNSHRRTCVRCGHTISYSPANDKLTVCPVCGGNLVVRTIDNPTAIRVRLGEYEHRTKPIFEFVESRGYTIFAVDGEADPDSVARVIQEKLAPHLSP